MQDDNAIAYRSFSSLFLILRSAFKFFASSIDCFACFFFKSVISLQKELDLVISLKITLKLKDLVYTCTREFLSTRPYEPDVALLSITVCPCNYKYYWS